MDAIRSQTHKDYDLFVVEKLRNKAAHHKLYSTFMENKNDFDFFIKIDADMVLCRNTFFEEVVDEMQEDPSVDHLEVTVDDFLTRKLIFGLSIFRNDVTWYQNEDNLFVDRVVKSKNKKVLSDPTHPLVPAARHCPDPSDFQAFHYGLHKAAKVIQADRDARDENGAAYHFSNIKAIMSNYLETDWEKAGYALFGALWALNNNIDHTWVDYDSDKAHKLFNDIQPADLSDKIAAEYDENNLFSALAHDYAYFHNTRIRKIKFPLLKLYIRKLRQRLFPTAG